MLNTLPASTGSLSQFSPEFMAALIAELRTAINAIVKECVTKSETLQRAPPPIADAGGQPMSYRRRKAAAIVEQAKRDGVTLSMGDAHELLDRGGAMKFARRVNGTKQAAEKAFAYCEAQRDLHRRQVPFSEAYAYFLGYSAEAP